MCSFSQATKLHRLRSADTDVQTKNSESTELLLYIHLELIADSSSIVFASLLSVQIYNWAYANCCNPGYR